MTRAHICCHFFGHGGLPICAKAFFPQRLPPQATEAGPADARCCIASAHHMRCAGRSATATAAAAAPRIRQSDFKRPSPDRGAQRPKATTQRAYTVRALLPASAQQFERAASLRSPRRRPASVSNCCRRPEIPTADSRPRSSVLLKSCLLKNVC